MVQVNLSTEKNYGPGVQAFGCQGGGRGSVMLWVLGVNICKLFPLEWISTEILLYSTENYVQSLMMEHDDVRKKDVYMYM